MKPRVPFSPREAQVLVGMLKGESDKAIGQDLGLSPETIKVHGKAVLRKLDVRSRTEAVSVVLRAALALPCPRCGYVDKPP